MQRGTNPQSLQSLIDSYNAEIMRYSQMARPAAPPMPAESADRRTAGEQERERGEEEAERGRTERDYWLARGKQGLQRGAPGGAPMVHRRRPEPDEPLYRPGSHMPRPEPDEPMECPDCHREHRRQEMNDPAVTASADARDMTEQEIWMRELEQGLRDLQRGLEELAQGQRDLLAGQEAYRQGIAERDRWRQAAVPTAMPISPSSGRNETAQPGENPMSGSNNAPPMPGGMNEREAGVLPPAQNRPGQQQSNENAPVEPISPDGRSAQSPESIPSDGMGTGYLQVGVYTARQSNPISNARVTVFRETPEGKELYASATTDDDGKIPLLQMPVGTSSAGGVSAPFAIYDVSVEADGYYPRNELQAQIFDGITALLWVELTPLSDSAWPPPGE